MKRQSSQFRNSSKPLTNNIEQKEKLQNAKEEEEELDDNSLDDIFRFDDKLIGKRTNTIFDVKPTNDGFYDIQDFNSDLSFESSNFDHSSSIFDTEINEIEEKKNQKFIRFIRALNNDNLDASLEEISEDDDLTEDETSKNDKVSRHQSVKQQVKQQQKTNQKLKEQTQKVEQKPTKPQQKPAEKTIKSEKPELKPKEPQKDIKNPQIPEKPLERKNEKSKTRKPDNKKISTQNPKEKIIYSSAKFDSKAEKTDKNDDDKVQPTAEKKSHVIVVQQVSELEKLNEVKSKERSDIAAKDQIQKVQSNNLDVVKVQKKFQNKDEMKEKRKVDENKTKEQSNKTVAEKIIQAAKKRQQRDRERRKRNLSSTPQEIKAELDTGNRRERRNISTAKRVTGERKIPKFKVGLQIEKPEKGEEYEPFGRMGEDGRYPKRLRIPPLRFWNNQRKNYSRGMLSSITLIDDSRGNRISQMIENLVNQAD